MTENPHVARGLENRRKLLEAAAGLVAEGKPPTVALLAGRSGLSYEVAKKLRARMLARGEYPYPIPPSRWSSADGLTDGQREWLAIFREAGPSASLRALARIHKVSYQTVQGRYARLRELGHDLPARGEPRAAAPPKPPGRVRAKREPWAQADPLPPDVLARRLEAARRVRAESLGERTEWTLDEFQRRLDRALEDVA